MGFTEKFAELKRTEAKLQRDYERLAGGLRDESWEFSFNFGVFSKPMKPVIIHAWRKTDYKEERATFALYPKLESETKIAQCLNFGKYDVKSDVTKDYYWKEARDIITAWLVGLSREA